MDALIGVVGGGQMGAGIAEVCARAGLAVLVHEVDDAAAHAARSRVEHSLDRAVQRGKLDTAQRDAALARVAYTMDLDAFADRTHVIEAVVESEPVKREIFARLDAVVQADDAVLASNTSSIPIARLAAATERPQSVIGVHFFNPAPVMSLVELIPALQTSDDTMRRAHTLVADGLGKEPIWCTDQAGFVVNALLVPYLVSAIRMLESGVASAADIDTGMVAGCGHPMGPLALSDLIGLDTLLSIAESLHAEYADPHLAPPPLLRRMVEAGRLGRKSGQGFHSYG